MMKTSELITSCSLTQPNIECNTKHRKPANKLLLTCPTERRPARHLTCSINTFAMLLYIFYNIIYWLVCLLQLLQSYDKTTWGWQVWCLFKFDAWLGTAPSFFSTSLMLPIERSSASTRSKLEVEDLQILLDSLDQGKLKEPSDSIFCRTNVTIWIFISKKLSFITAIKSQQFQRRFYVLTTNTVDPLNFKNFF